MIYPEFSGLEVIDFQAWQSQAIEALKNLGDDAIVVVHSLEGPALLKILADTNPVRNIRALYLVAVPCKCTDEE